MSDLLIVLSRIKKLEKYIQENLHKPHCFLVNNRNGISVKDKDSWKHCNCGLYEIFPYKQSYPITSQMVCDLHEETGAGLTDCRKSLEICDGDYYQAISRLRTMGQA